MGYIEPVNQETLHDRKDGCVRPDCQTQRDCRKRCKAPALSQYAHGIADVLNNALKQRQANLSVILFANRFHCPKFQYCLAAGLVRRHAGSQVPFCLEGEMLLHLLPKTPLIDTLTRHKVAKSDEQSLEPLHGRVSAWMARNRARISAVCFQPRSSACNCFRPERVIR